MKIFNNNCQPIKQLFKGGMIEPVRPNPIGPKGPRDPKQTDIFVKQPVNDEEQKEIK